SVLDSGQVWNIGSDKLHGNRFTATSTNKDQWLRTGWAIFIEDPDVKFVRIGLAVSGGAAHHFYFDQIQFEIAQTDTEFKDNTTRIDGFAMEAESILGRYIAAETIAAGNIQAGAITVNKLAANSVTTDKLVANNVTADKLSIRGQNLIRNGNFDRFGQQTVSSGSTFPNLLDGWRTAQLDGSMFLQDTGNKVYGQSSLKFSGWNFTSSARCETKVDPLTGKYPAIKANTTYAYGMWVYKYPSSVASQPVRMEVRTLDEAGTSVID